MLGLLDLYPDLVIEDPKEDLICWANRSASYMEHGGDGLVPPEGIFDYPDLLERGWGWTRLVPSESSPEDMPTYKKYLKDYYSRNTAESVAQAWLNELDANPASYGTGVETGLLTILAKLCMDAEERFINKMKNCKTGPADEINLSKKILQGVSRIMLLEGEFPVAPAALMFITKEAELMCEWLAIGTYCPDHDWCVRINIARRCALDLLEHKGPESSCVAGLMIGIAKETKTICEAMRGYPRGPRKRHAILLDGWEVLEELHGEIVSASQDGAIAEINTVGELTSKETDGKDSCKIKANADVNSANPNTALEVATVNGLTLVTWERERPSVPRSRNAVPGTGTREHFRSHSVKLHPKPRSRSSIHCSGSVVPGTAVTKGLTDCIKKLEAAADPKIANNQSQDGADVNSTNPNTALEVVTVNGLTDCIKKLEAAADPKIANNQVATVNGLTDCIKKLEAGADPKIAKNQVENCGKTALELKLDGDKAVGRKDYLAASMFYTQAIELDPDNAILYSNRSLCHLQIGEASKALVDANICIKIQPNWLKGYYRKGVALMSLKEHKDAYDAFLAGQQLDPTNVEMGRMVREAIVARNRTSTIN